jgi:hypothetical protein
MPAVIVTMFSFMTLTQIGTRRLAVTSPALANRNRRQEALDRQKYPEQQNRKQISTAPEFHEYEPGIALGNDGTDYLGEAKRGNHKHEEHYRKKAKPLSQGKNGLSRSDIPVEPAFV